MHPFRAKLRFLLAPLSVAFLSTCGGGDQEPSIQVLNPWVRPMAVEVDADGGVTPGNSAVYLSLQNHGPAPDLLVSGTTPAAGDVEIHGSFLEGDVMRMREVGSVEVPQGGEVDLRPGGIHIMLLGLSRSLAIGDTIPLTLLFQNFGAVEVRVPVRATGGS